MILHTGQGFDVETFSEPIDPKKSAYTRSINQRARKALDQLYKLMGDHQFLWASAKRPEEFDWRKPTYRFQFVLNVDPNDTRAVLLGWHWQYIIHGLESTFVPDLVADSLKNDIGRVDSDKAIAWVREHAPADPWAELIQPYREGMNIETLDDVLIAWPFSKATTVESRRENDQYMNR